MSITSRIRKSPIIVTTVLLAFVAGYLFPYLSEIGSQFFSPSKVTIGTIAGHKVSYYPDYRNLYDEMLRQEVQMYGQYYEGIDANVHRKVWEKLTLQHGFKSTYDALGLDVTPEERYDMVLGNDIPEQMRALPQFQNPETETFDKERYIMFWKKMVNDTTGRHIAKSFEEDLAAQRLQEKLGMLIEKSTHTPKFIKKKKKQLQQSITIRVLCIPYASISDSLVRNKITEQDRQAYYQTHKERFLLKEEESTRTIAYVQFPILPDNQEIKKAEQTLEALKERFLHISPKKAKDFAAQYTDNPEEVMVQWEEKDLPKYLKDALSKIKQDKHHEVIGPVRQGTVVVLYKYIGIGTSGSWTIGNQEQVHLFAKIERKVDTKDISKNKTFTEASNFARAAKNSHTWKKIAEEEYGLVINTATLTLQEARQVGKGPYRKLIRWLFCDAEIGTISPPIPIKDNYYIVAIMTEEQKSGYPAPNKVKSTIDTILFNKQKATIIKEKLSKIGIDNKSLHEIKRTYGSDAFVLENEILHFDDNEIAPNYYAPSAVGASFALKIGTRTTLIEDEKYLIIVERIPNSTQVQAERTTTKPEKKDDTINEKEKVVNLILEDKIEDNRFRFYD